MSIFNFEKSEIEFMEDMKLSGTIHTVHAERMLKIHRQRVNPSHEFCTTCGESMSANFQLLYGIMCRALNVKDLSVYLRASKHNDEVKPLKEDQAQGNQMRIPTVSKEDIMKLTKLEIIQLVKKELDETIDPKTRADARRIAIELFKIS